ncbi:formylglycine-generating enzyme family protein [Pelolinea submarina]|jgi:formylglycine-generating enzyme required for sulfatase activity|uniref:Formylglycine-generating enzyme required for sulfatase activity n=1 Tax=Pelolinea submarina TaxID=913107 RepID=A0A3E0ABR2_9CHLR|nr:SUMF1/EgtB/PvdO family nonheme iron enzyme [Pelolinea submarina]REG08600.1 formylglycine-generating enzyme required for sulfatase activity [Pelolinea submarina]
MSETKVPLFVCGKDNRPMVKVPAGEFLYGEDQEKTETKEFFIDLYPVTNADYKKFVDATGHTEPASWRKGTWPEGKENHPVVEVNWESASAYAAWAGKRLPTNEEWEKAARGTDGRTWPWGNEFDRDKCNTFSGDTTPVGQYSPAGDSPYGCQDMAGNVWEWIGGGKPSQLRAPLRGGDWLDGAEEAQTFFIRMHTPLRKNPFVGFRCAADSAEPMK